MNNTTLISLNEWGTITKEAQTGDWRKMEELKSTYVDLVNNDWGGRWPAWTFAAETNPKVLDKIIAHEIQLLQQQIDVLQKDSSLWGPLFPGNDFTILEYQIRTTVICRMGYLSAHGWPKEHSEKLDKLRTTCAPGVIRMQLEPPS